MAEILIRNLSPQLRNDFKSLCAKHGTDMNALLTKLIKQVVTAGDISVLKEPILTRE